MLFRSRAQITGYYPRSGQCQEYDRKLTVTLADKVVDLLLREEYGQMPVITKIVKQIELEEYNTSSIDMGSIGNRPLQDIYYNLDQYNFTPAYDDFLSHIIDKPEINEFKYDFPIVLPK